MGVLDLLFLAAVGFFVYRAIATRQSGDDHRDEWTIDPPDTGNRPAPKPNPDPAPVESADSQVRDTSEQPPDKALSGLRHIHQMDPRFDQAEFLEAAGQVFRMVQQANANNELTRVRELLEESLFQQLDAEARQDLADGVRQHLEDVQIHRARIVDAQQRSGTDSILVEFDVSIRSWSEDAQGQVLDGDREQPERFHEYWKFMRNIGEEVWQVAGIEEAPDGGDEEVHS